MRKPRLLVVNGQYHVISRINRHLPELESEESKQLFLDVVERAKEKYDFSIQNFCIMPNHVHMIVIPKDGTELPRIMQWILSVFAKAFNRMFNLKGHLWYDRYKSILIKTTLQLVRTFRYIARNPVLAGLVKRPQDYAFNGVTFLAHGDFRIMDQPPQRLAEAFLRGIV